MDSIVCDTVSSASPNRYSAKIPPCPRTVPDAPRSASAWCRLFLLSTGSGWAAPHSASATPPDAAGCTRSPGAARPVPALELSPQLVPLHKVLASRLCDAPSLNSAELNATACPPAIWKSPDPVHSGSSPRAEWHTSTSCAPSTGEMPTCTCAPPPPPPYSAQWYNSAPPPTAVSFQRRSS